MLIVTLIGAIALNLAHFGSSITNKPVFMNRVVCRGSEVGLLAYPYILRDGQCGHSNDASAVCSMLPGILNKTTFNVQFYTIYHSLNFVRA